MKANLHRFSRSLGVAAFLLFASQACQDAARHAPASPSPADAAEAPRDLARTLDVSLEVADVDRADRRVRALVARLGGLVQKGSLLRGEAPYGEIDALVPAGALGALRGSFARIGRVEVVTEQVEDVTAARVDLDARLRNARAREERLRGLLVTATGNLADVLAVEQELGRVREEIETRQAARDALGERIEYVLTHIRFRPRAIAFFERPGEAISTAAVEGWRTAWGMSVGIVVLAVRVGPSFGVLAGLFGFVLLAIRVLLRRRGPRASASA